MASNKLWEVVFKEETTSTSYLSGRVQQSKKLFEQALKHDGTIIELSRRSADGINDYYTLCRIIFDRKFKADGFIHTMNKRKLFQNMKLRLYKPTM